MELNSFEIYMFVEISNVNTTSCQLEGVGSLFS